MPPRTLNRSTSKGKGSSSTEMSSKMAKTATTKPSMFSLKREMSTTLSRSQIDEGGAGSKKKASVAERSPPETSGSSQNPIHEAPGGKALWGRLKAVSNLVPLHTSHRSLRVPVTGCHTLYSVLTFCVSSLFPLLHLHAYLDEHYQLTNKNYGLMKFEEFWSFNFTPLTFWALLISFMLQPCNKSKWHKAMLTVQYIVYSFSFTTSYFNFFGRSVVMLIITIFLLVLLLFATLKVRSIVASLEKRGPKKLSEFLSKSVIYKGLLLGSIKLTFLVFTSIKCETELWEEEEKSDLEHPWRACNRTLYSQTGLGIMIIIYLTLTVLSGIASTSVLEDHTVNLKKAWTMDMDFAESVQCCGISLSTFLAIYLAGNYGAEGDFRSELDRNLIYLAAWIGSLSLLFSQIPAAFKVWKEQESEKLKQEISALKAENAKLKAYLDFPPKETRIPEESVKGPKVKAEDLVKKETPKYFVEGLKVEARYGGKSEYMPGKITRVHKNGSVDIDYGTELSVEKEDDRTLDASSIELSVGLEVEVKYSGKSEYIPAKITHIRENGTVDIKYDNELNVKKELVRTYTDKLEAENAKLEAENAKLKAKLDPPPEEPPKKEETRIQKDSVKNAKLKLKAKLLSEEPPKQEETRTKESFKGPKVEAEDLVKNETPEYFVEGLKVEAKYRGKSEFIPGKIARVHEDGTVDIDYCTEVRVKPEDVRTLDASPFEPTVGLEVEVRSGKPEYVRGKITVVHEDGTVDVKYEKEKSLNNVSPEFVRTLEASSFWTTIAILITSLQSTLIIAGTITLDDFYTTLSTALFPFTAVLVFGAWFCQPQRKSRKEMYLHFASYAYVGEGSNLIWALRLDDLPQAGYHLGRAVLWTLIFVMVFKIRDFLNDLEPKKLEEFLRSTICDKGLATLSLLLFLTFRTTKCAVEEGSLSECAVTAKCSTWISIYLLFGWLALIVDGSVPDELTPDFNLTWEKIARTRGVGIKTRQIFQGVLALITIACGNFLFSLMSINSNDEDVATTIFAVGIVGGSFAFLVVVIELSCAFAQREELNKELKWLDEDVDGPQRTVRAISETVKSYSNSFNLEDPSTIEEGSVRVRENPNIIKEVWSG
ncbi:hypothetical protein TrVE_jg13185 [Triparma verrucosa]|uniref:Uncharacterized protein n=1 Tax=Triparma verrucosa TaxID=1606542 RepID=A0A9W7ET68_9STRA|nr:hypothetical protein TrVE_jg13185 [Triparma verrucosa]